MTMPNIVIYTSANCSYCEIAKQILDQRKLNYTEIRVDTDPKQREIMMERSGRRTVPQIFINEKHIGGCDDLIALISAGKFEELLK